MKSPFKVGGIVYVIDGSFPEDFSMIGVVTGYTAYSGTTQGDVLAFPGGSIYHGLPRFSREPDALFLVTDPTQIVLAKMGVWPYNDEAKKEA